MSDEILPGSALRDLVAAQARERMLLVAEGVTGAWAWPETVRILPSKSQDDLWLYELELGCD